MTHVVIDDALPPAILRSVAASWPGMDSDHWHCYDDANSVKRASRSWDGLPVSARTAISRLAEQVDVEHLLGIAEVFPDLDGLHGAGLHEMDRGGVLRLHVDAECHPRKPWTREASGVLYLDSCDGGELELCDEAGKTVESIAPRFNRLVLFTCRGQWHRVAECRSLRRSICLFWWRQGASGGNRRAVFRGVE